MKRAFLFLLAAVMLLSAGCGAQAPAGTTAPENTAAETTESTEPQASTQALPETAEVLVLADHVPAILTFKNRGDTLDIVGDYDEEHYVVKTESGFGLVQKVLVRAAGQEPYESWKGFARYNAMLYDNLELRGEPKVLAQNTETEVLEDLGTCLLVRLEESMGLVKKDQISRWRIQDGGGSGDSGPSDGSGGGGNQGQDGGDITLQLGFLVSLSAIEQSGEPSGEAQVLADGTPVILSYFDRGNPVPVVVDPDPEQLLGGYGLLCFDGLYAHMRLQLLQPPGDESYEA